MEERSGSAEVQGDSETMNGSLCVQRPQAVPSSPLRVKLCLLHVQEPAHNLLDGGHSAANDC